MTGMVRHIHLDPVGGIAGDMFLAAAIDAFPGLADGVIAAMHQAGLPAECRPAFQGATSNGLSGCRFAITEPSTGPGVDDPGYAAIRASLEASGLAPPVKKRALHIYRLLAEAEAAVHATSVDAVSFHELAAWDTIADVVGAAFVIDALSAQAWSVAALPLGGGRIDGAHGVLPVPAPATSRLLEGFDVVDDGIAGERVTPTGAAILRHLAPFPGPPRAPHRLVGEGWGLGTRDLPGIANGLRMLVLEPGARLEKLAGVGSEPVAVIEFEVDDQSPEDLALGLDRLRAMAGVVDVMQVPVFGKKNRIAVHVQVLCQPDARCQVMAGCFDETTTLGLRWRLQDRAVLQRTAIAGDPAVKVAERPGGRRTAKAESGDLTGIGGGHVARRTAARLAEDDALDRMGEGKPR